MTNDIDKRVSIDRIIAQVRRLATQFGVLPERDDITLLYSILEDMLPDVPEGAPSELQRVESTLVDYQPFPPFRIYMNDTYESLDFSDYAQAQRVARHHSAALRSPVLIRDAKSVVTWEIRLTDRPLND